LKYSPAAFHNDRNILIFVLRIMSGINRKRGPAISNKFDLRISDVLPGELDNGIPLYELNTGTQDIIKVELVYKAGRIHEKKPAVSKSAIKLILEGSESRSSEETAHIFDYHGAVFKAESTMEYSSVSLVCLNSHFEKLWPVWLDTVLNPAYRDEDLDKYREIRSKALNNQLSKNDVLAYRELTAKIFGESHPYGYNTEPSDILALNTAMLKDYHRTQCALSSAFIVLSGQYSDKIRGIIVESLGSVPLGEPVPEKHFPDPENKQGSFHIESSNDVQTSLKMGCLWVPRRHKDFVALRFLNTVLGGYFGSRLMKNIREDKGFTYGIYSAYDSWQKEGYFYISTEMGRKHLDQGLSEIFKEIDLLKKRGIHEDEMKMVKNYLLGQSLNLIDGPFATAQLVKSLRAKDIDLSIFEHSVAELRSLEEKHIVDLARNYLHPEKFTQVFVGQF
jgi:zinc protease